MPRVSRPRTDLVDQPTTTRKFETELQVTADEIATIADPIDDDPDDDPASPPAEIEPLSDEARTVIAEQKQYEHIADELLNRAAGGAVLTADERLILRRVCPPKIATGGYSFEQWLTRQADSRRGIREHQRVAGTPADRKADADAMDAAQDRRRTEGTVIAAKIADLQKQLGDLDTDLRKATARVEQRERAVTALTSEKLLPIRIVEHIRVLHQTIRTDRIAASAAKSVVRAFHGLSQLDPASNAEHASYLMTTLTDFVDGIRSLDLVFPLAEPPHIPCDANPKKFSPEGWQRYLAFRRIAANEAAQELQKLGDVDARIRTEVDLLLSYWLPKDAAEPAAAK